MVCPTRLLADAAFAGADELDEMFDLGQWRQFAFDLGESGGHGRGGVAGQDFLRVLDGVLSFFRDAIAFNTDLVDGMNDGGLAIGKHERWDILPDLGAAADHDEFADATKLMHGDVAGEYDVVFQHDMPRKAGKTGHDDMTAQLAIMGDMGVGEKNVVRAEHGGVAIVGGTMDGDAFAKDVMITN